MLHWSRLAVFWRESKRFPNVPNGATKGFTDVFSNIWMHHRPTSTLKDSYATMEHVTPITAANKRSLDIKNVQFSHLLSFFFATERCRRKTLRRGRPKWWQSPIDITTRCIAMIVTRLPNFGVKRLRTDLWSSFTVRHSSMFIDVHTQSVAKWNGICSGDNTRVRGCLCICYVSYALSQRDITRYNFIQWNWSGRSVKSRLNISHIFILFRSRIESSAKWCLIVGEKDLPNC